jgi:hypothetical protein
MIVLVQTAWDRSLDTESYGRSGAGSVGKCLIQQTGQSHASLLQLLLH